MSNISSRILRSVTPSVPAVKIEKASADPINGVAKVLFTINQPPKKAREVIANANAMETAFADVLGDKAHLVTSSIHKSEVDGHYYAFVKLNRPVVEHADAVKEGSGFHLVAANVFADDNDNIWEVKEDASGNKVLLRNSQEDLMELFNQVAPSANMSVAASTIAMSGTLEFASVVTFMHPQTETYHEGVVLDTAHVWDSKTKKVEAISPAMVVAASDQIGEVRRELNARMGDEQSTFPEIAAANVQAVFDYLETLYGRMPAFLAAYKDAVRRILDTK